jgi:hypothetical protein
MRSASFTEPLRKPRTTKLIPRALIQLSRTHHPQAINEATCLFDRNREQHCRLIIERTQENARKLRKQALNLFESAHRVVHIHTLTPTTDIA